MFLGNPTNCLYLDGEFTSGKNNEHLIQLGIVEYNTITYELINEVCLFVKPKKYVLDWYVKKLTKITNEQVESGIDFSNIYLILSKAGIHKLKKKTIFCWGHNDKRVIDRTCRENNIESQFNIFDLSKQYQHIYGFPTDVSLKRAAESLNLEFEGKHHNALADANIVAKIHIELLKRFRKFNNIESKLLPQPNLFIPQQQTQGELQCI